MKYFLILISLISLSGCATIMQGAKQKITILSSPSGSDVSINGKKAGITPMVVKLKRKDLQEIEVSHQGYESETRIFQGQSQRSFLVADAILALPTLGIVFIIDGKLSSFKKFQFDTLVVSLSFPKNKIQAKNEEIIDKQKLDSIIVPVFDDSKKINKIVNSLFLEENKKVKIPKNIISYNILPFISEGFKDIVSKGEQYQLLKYEVSYERILNERSSIEFSFLKKNPVCLNCKYELILSDKFYDEINMMKFTETYQGSIVYKLRWKDGIYIGIGGAYRNSKSDKALITTGFHSSSSSAISINDSVKFNSDNYQFKLLIGNRFQYPIFNKNFISFDLFTGLVPSYSKVDIFYYTISNFGRNGNVFSGKKNFSDKYNGLVKPSFLFGLKIGFMF